MLILDALYPGTPSQLLANLKAVGAAGCPGYVWRPGGIGGWDSAHFDALRSAGMVTAPIVVPAGDGSTSYSELIAAAKSFGFSSGPLIFDMESPYNLPSQSWWNGAIPAVRAAGFKAIKYGNQGDVGAYANGDGWWKASYIQTTTNPVPALPSGLVGWQYADMDPINGIEYDASVFNPGLFEEAGMLIAIGTDGPDADGNYGVWQHTGGTTWTRFPAPTAAVGVLANGVPNPVIYNAAGDIFQWDGSKWVGIGGKEHVAAAGPAAPPAPHSHSVSLSGTTGDS